MTHGKNHKIIDWSITMMDIQKPFVFLLSILLCKAVHGNDETEEEILIEDWFNLIRYMMGLAFLIFGILFLLYSDIGTYSLLRSYNKLGRSIPGEVLSCAEIPGHVKKFEIEVLYSAESPKYKDYRKQFRYPDAMETREYLRRFQTDWKTPRGSMVELIILPGIPTSACTSEMIDLKLYSISKLGTLPAKLCMVLPPALTLICLFSYLAYRQVMDFSSNSSFVTSYIVVVSCLMLFVLISWSICDVQFQEMKRKVFHSAVCVRRKSGGPRRFDKEAPLIQYNEDIPVVV
jgi:hypothetical protein